MRIRETIGLALLGLGLAGCPPPEANVAPAGPEDIYHLTRPLLTWPHQGGRRYSLSLLQTGDFRVGAAGQRIPNVMVSKPDYELGSYRPDFDLRWNKAYVLKIATKDEEGRTMELQVRFKVAFQVATPVHPAARSTVASIEPTFAWKRADQADCRYHFQLADREDFGTTLVDSDHLAGAYVHALGPDRLTDTADDTHTIYNTPDVVLQPQRGYYWRVRTIYYQGSFNPTNEIGRGEWGAPNGFTVAPQPDLSGELLDTLTQITSSPDAEVAPALSVNDDIACQRRRRPGGDLVISEIIMVKSKKDEAGTIGYERGVQQVTTSLSSTQDRQPKWDEKGEGILFHSDRTDNQYNVWYRPLARRGLEQLTTTHRHGAFSPAVSPDGARVVYAALDEQRNASIWFMSRDGSRPTQVTGGSSPCWSPDGKQIAFQLRDQITGNDHIWTMAVDGLEKQQITAQGSNIEPSWSPDGRLIAYTSNRSGNWDIWTLDLDGATDRQVTNYLGTDGGPAWSPDGRRLAFHSTRNTREFNIWLGTVKR